MKVLNIVLALNTLSCLFFGILFVSQPDLVGTFLGLSQDLGFLVPASGTVLLLFAGHLMWAISRKEKIKGEIYYFVFGDVLWVVFSGLIVILGVVSQTTPVLAIAGVATLVGVFAQLQLFAGSRIASPNRLTVEGDLSVDLNQAWPALADFSNISRYHPLVKESTLESEVEKGIGAKRRCVFTDETTVLETITKWDEGAGYRVTIEGMRMPLRDFENEISLINRDGEKKIKLTATFYGKGFFNEMLLGFLMRPLMKRQLNRVLVGFQQGIKSA